MPLENWFEISKLIKHKTNKQELDAIFGVIDRDFKDAGLRGLSSEHHEKTVQYYCSNCHKAVFWLNYNIGS